MTKRRESPRSSTDPALYVLRTAAASPGGSQRMRDAIWDAEKAAASSPSWSQRAVTVTAGGLPLGLTRCMHLTRDRALNVLNDSTRKEFAFAIDHIQRELQYLNEIGARSPIRLDHARAAFLEAQIGAAALWVASSLERLRTSKRSLLDERESTFVDSFYHIYPHLRPQVLGAPPKHSPYFNRLLEDYSEFTTTLRAARTARNRLKRCSSRGPLRFELQRQAEQAIQHLVVLAESIPSRTSAREFVQELLMDPPADGRELYCQRLAEGDAAEKTLRGSPPDHFVSASTFNRRLKNLQQVDRKLARWLARAGKQPQDPEALGELINLIAQRFAVA